MESEIISAGAEAIIKKHNATIIKERTPKSYRHPDLDKKIIKRRTKSETKLLLEASKIVNVPVPKEQEEINIIEMPEIKGDKLSQKLDFYSNKKQEKIMFEIGRDLAKLHEAGIIHGDLTTSNMICSEDDKIYFIDFGLGYFNGKYEDKGVDVHLLKQALEAKHFKNWQILFKEFEIGYRSINPKEADKVFDKLKAIEERGRYKH
jgi:Kae1-associated kinase Bud32